MAKYLHAGGLFFALLGALYMTRDVWPEAAYQSYAAKLKSQVAKGGGGVFS